MAAETMEHVAHEQEPELEEEQPPSMEVPSSPPEQPSRHRSRANRKAFPDNECACVAMLRAQCLTSAEAGAKAYKAVLACHGISVHQPSVDTIHRATVEGGILANYAMIRLLVESKDLWVGIDESSKVNGWSFVVIEFAGSHPKLGFVLYPAAVIEVISHTSENMLGYIENTLAELNQKGLEQGLSAIKLWEFRSITFDLTSSNSGRIGGLGHLLNEQRRQLWEQESTPKPPFTLLLVKGCDHIAALILNEFLCRTNKLATGWGAADLLQSNAMEENEEHVAAAVNESNGVTMALKKLSCLLRGLWNADWMGFVEHEKEHNPNLVSHKSRAIPKASKTCYVSYALMARFVEDHEEVLHCFLEKKVGEHAFADEIQTGLFGNSLAVTMHKVLVCGLSQVLLPLMHIGNHDRELLPYLHDFWLLQRHLLALASNPLMLKQCFACPAQSYASPLLSSEVLLTMENFAAQSWTAPGDDRDLQALLAKEFISSALFMLYKHAGQFMEMREEEEEDEWETYSLTPNQVEAVYEAEKQKETEEELQEQEEQQVMMTTDAATMDPLAKNLAAFCLTNRSGETIFSMSGRALSFTTACMMGALMRRLSHQRRLTMGGRQHIKWWWRFGYCAHGPLLSFPRPLFTPEAGWWRVVVFCLPFCFELSVKWRCCGTLPPCCQPKKQNCNGKEPRHGVQEHGRGAMFLGFASLVLCFLSVQGS